ncbi:MAG: hypothetical protein ACODAU_12520 [Myxococcota bacterium]
MIERKRSIPRVAAAALTLGGGAAGCGGDGDSTLADFCRERADCHDGSTDYARQCLADYQEYLSYYDALCAGALRDLLACRMELGTVCESFSGCNEEEAALDSACVPPPPPPGPYRDFCELYVDCYPEHGEGYLAECHQYFMELRDELEDYYGAACGAAFDAAVACFGSNLSCAELYSGDISDCDAEYDEFLEVCYSY